MEEDEHKDWPNRENNDQNDTQGNLSIITCGLASQVEKENAVVKHFQIWLNHVSDDGTEEELFHQVVLNIVECFDLLAQKSEEEI